MRKIITICILVLAGLGAGPVHSGSGPLHPPPESRWELVKTESGIALYERSPDGKDYREYKGVTHFKGSLASVVALLGDIRSYPSWLYTCNDARLLKNGEAGERYLYFIYDVPVYSNRDAVMRSCAARSSDGNQVTMKFSRVAQSGTPGLFKGAGITRDEDLAYVKELAVSWQLARSGDGVDVVYSIYLDPDIGFPGSLKVNGTTEGLVFESLKKMGVKLREATYRNAPASVVEALPSRGGC